MVARVANVPWLILMLVVMMVGRSNLLGLVNRLDNYSPSDNPIREL